MELDVSDLDIDDHDWARVVAMARGTSPFHQPALVRAAAASSGCRVVALGARRGTELVGGVAAIVTPSGSILPRSMAAYNGPLIAPIAGAHPRARHRHESAIAGALLEELLRRHPLTSLRMRPGTFDIRWAIDRGWVSSMSFTYLLEIGDVTSAWQRMSPDRRRLVRRAESRGLRVRECIDAPPELVGRMSELHALQQGTYGAALDLDRVGWRTAVPMLLGSRAARLFVVETPAGGLVSAFLIVTASRPSAAVLVSGADPAGLDDGAATLLRWDVIRRLSADGVEVLDLNGARTGVHGRFKSSFGGELAERWELRPPVDTATWRTIPRRALRQVRSDIRSIRGKSR